MNKLYKEVKDIYWENQKTFMNEIEDSTKKWKDILYTQTRRVCIDC